MVPYFLEHFPKNVIRLF